MKRLSIDSWKDIFRNIAEYHEEEVKEFGDSEFGESVEILWLEGNGVDTFEEWVLGHGYDCFEDGFKTEEEATKRLNDIYKSI